MTTLVDCYIHLDSKTQRWWLEHDKQDFQLLTLRGFPRSSSFRSESMLVRSECKDQVPEFLKVKNYRDDNESPSISRDLKSHIEHVGRVLDRLLPAKLHAKPSNCDLIFFFSGKHRALVVHLLPESVSIDPERVDPLSRGRSPEPTERSRCFWGSATSTVASSAATQI